MTDATPPDRLEAELKDRLRWLCSIFGQPSDLLRVLPILEWRRLRTWVRGLEALAARLVRALAAAIPAGPQMAPRPAPAIAGERFAPDTDYPDSDRWTGVRFRFRDGHRAAAPIQTMARDVRLGLAEPADATRGFRSARHLALRLEAAIRVAENPGRYAKRLARRQARPRPKTPRRIATPTPNAAGVPAPGSALAPPEIESG